MCTESQRVDLGEVAAQVRRHDERGAEVTELVLTDEHGQTRRIPLTMRPAKCERVAA